VVPSFVYSEEKDLHYALTKKLTLKRKRACWGIQRGPRREEQELSKILVEAYGADDTKTANDLNPVQARVPGTARRRNVARPPQRIGLMAPKGEVDKILGDGGQQPGGYQ